MKRYLGVFVLGVCLLGLTGISRDGTLPARMSGLSSPVPSNGQNLRTEVRLFRTQPAPDLPFRCGLSGRSTRSTSIAGDLQVGTLRAKVIGTCHNPATREVEVVTDNPGTRLQGRLSNKSTFELKGVLKTPQRSLKVELK